MEANWEWATDAIDAGIAEGGRPVRTPNRGASPDRTVPTGLHRRQDDIVAFTIVLVIRQEQIQALAGQLLDSFADRLTEELMRDFPEQSMELNRQEVRDAIDFGCKKAMGYGLDLQKDLATYVYLMFTFGRDFDSDPAFGWTAEYLGQIRRDPAAFQRLVSAAGQFEHVGGGLNSTHGEALL